MVIFTFEREYKYIQYWLKIINSNMFCLNYRSLRYSVKSLAFFSPQSKTPSCISLTLSGRTRVNIYWDKSASRSGPRALPSGLLVGPPGVPFLSDPEQWTCLTQTPNCDIYSQECSTPNHRPENEAKLQPKNGRFWHSYTQLIHMGSWHVRCCDMLYSIYFKQHFAIS